MLRCIKRTRHGTCGDEGHTPRCTFIRELFCEDGWLIPFMIFIALVMAGAGWYVISHEAHNAIRMNL